MTGRPRKFSEEHPDLYKACASATRDRLISTLFNLCSLSESNCDVVESMLLVEEDSDSDNSSSLHSKSHGGAVSVGRGTKDSPAVIDLTSTPTRQNGSHTSPQSSSTSKRRRPRYEVCINCNEEFDVTGNEEENCVWHDGEVEPIEDMFPDHDERVHGPYDQDWIRRDFPESFEYTCCEGDLNSDGCNVTRHEAKKEKASKWF
ncbi:MAG: hypothetical protein Q9160_007653 [Pyrenula sp. 1 TL-2023]